jgi:hypothetical protein
MYDWGRAFLLTLGMECGVWRLRVCTVGVDQQAIGIYFTGGDSLKYLSESVTETNLLSSLSFPIPCNKLGNNQIQSGLPM